MLSDLQLNIEEMINKSHGDIAYNIIDINGDVGRDALDEITRIDGVITVRQV